MAKVRYGLISTAQISRNKHVPAAKASSNSVIDAVASRTIDKAREFASDCGIPRAYGTYEELLRDQDIDAVLIGLPNGMHHEWAIKSAEAGKHILCEKPLASKVSQAKEMVAAAKANGVLLMEAFTHRFNPTLKFVRDAVKNGTIGKVSLATAELTFPLRNWKDDVRIQESIEGGSLLDAGCYAVTALSFVLDEQPASVTGSAHSRQGIKVDTAFTGVLSMPGGALATAFSSFEASRKNSLEVIGWDGKLYVPEMFAENGSVIVEKGGDNETKKFEAPDRFRVQIEHFSDCILHRKPLEFPPEDAIKNVAVYEALLESANTGRRVDVSG